jgi:hypothetical protein
MMQNRAAQHSKSVLGTWQVIRRSALMLICALALLGTAVEAQTITVLHNFTDRADGGDSLRRIDQGPCGELLRHDQRGW